MEAGEQIFTIHDAFPVPFNKIDSLIQHAKEFFKINEQLECSLSTNQTIEITLHIYYNITKVTNKVTSIIKLTIVRLIITR